MFLSDTQMMAVNHDVKSQNSFEWVGLPTGPQPIPNWAKGFHIDWMDGYGNRPHYSIKATCDLRSWPEKTFEKYGSRYMATASDGRAEIYYHDGAISPTQVLMFRREDGTIHRDRRQGPEWYVAPEYGEMWPKHGYEPGEWVDVERLATTPQSGFGGANVFVNLTDGRQIVLRGPWHGGSPQGYTEVAYVDTSRDYIRSYKKRSRRWHQIGGMVGLYITEDLFLRLLARFAPECRCARVTMYGCAALEAVRGDWDAPKHWQRRVA